MRADRGPKHPPLGVYVFDDIVIRHLCPRPARKRQFKWEGWGIRCLGCHRLIEVVPIHFKDLGGDHDE